MKSILKSVVCDRCKMVFPLDPGEDYVKKYLHKPCPECGKGEILSDKDMKQIKSMRSLAVLGTVLEWVYYLTHPWRLFMKPEMGKMSLRYDSTTGTWKVKDVKSETA